MLLWLIKSIVIAFHYYSCDALSSISYVQNYHDETSYIYYVPQHNKLDRNHVKQILNDIILPLHDYGYRRSLQSFHDQQSKTKNDGILFTNINDPLLSESYGEFPFDSIDILIDRAEEEIMKHPQHPRRNIQIVDVGSGCGRLALYLSLSRNNNNFTYNIHGIEISSIFHNEAIQATKRAIQYDYIHTETTNDNDRNEQNQNNNNKLSQRQEDVIKTTNTNTNNTLQFHLGSAENFVHIIQQADIIFCYSTAFSSNGFNPDISAMILNDYWCELLTSQIQPQQEQDTTTTIDNKIPDNDDNDDYCNNNTIIITTEKAINPKYNWIVIDRIDVPNPEIFGSTGFIHKKLRDEKK